MLKNIESLIEKLQKEKVFYEHYNTDSLSKLRSNDDVVRILHSIIVKLEDILEEA